MPMKYMSAMSSMSLKDGICARGDFAMSWCMRCSEGMSGCSALRSHVISPMTSPPLQRVKINGA